MLVLATVSESRELLYMQQQGFADLYARYQDPYNPAIEDLEHFQSRFQREGCSFYKIVEEGETIGLLRVTISEERNLGWVGLIVLLPEYRKKGMLRRLFWSWKDSIRQSLVGFYVPFHRRNVWLLFIKNWAIKVLKCVQNTREKRLFTT